MKRMMMFFAALLMCGTMWAQQVFTVVYATSDDGFLNVRERPSSKARVLGKLWMLNHGLGDGVWYEERGSWTRVKVGDVMGWCYSKYVGKLTWYKGTGRQVLVGAMDNTPVWRESMEDAAKHLYFATVPKGTIIADEFYDAGEYWELRTAHDNLYIRKTDAEVRENFGTLD